MEKIREIDLPESSELQPLQAGDVDTISRTIASMDPWRTLGYKPEALSFYLLRADPALFRFSVIISGRLSGVLSVRFPWLFGPFIELIALFDGFRRRGLGRALIEWICAQYPSSPNAWVTVSSFNHDAQKFYARLGFERTAVLEDLIQPGRDEILLRKRLL